LLGKRGVKTTYLLHSHLYYNLLSLPKGKNKCFGPPGGKEGKRKDLPSSPVSGQKKKRRRCLELVRAQKKEKKGEGPSGSWPGQRRRGSVGRCGRAWRGRGRGASCSSGIKPGQKREKTHLRGSGREKRVKEDRIITKGQFLVCMDTVGEEKKKER